MKVHDIFQMFTYIKTIRFCSKLELKLELKLEPELSARGDSASG